MGNTSSQPQRYTQGESLETIPSQEPSRVHNHSAITESTATTAPSQAPLPITALPDNVVLEVLTYLDIPSLISVSATCERLRSIAYIPKLWKYHYVDLGNRNNLGDQITLQSFAERRIGTVVLTESDESNLEMVEHNVNDLISEDSYWKSNCVESLRIYLREDSTVINQLVRLLKGFSNLRSLVLVVSVNGIKNIWTSEGNLAEAIVGLETLEKLMIFTHGTSIIDDSVWAERKAAGLVFQALSHTTSGSMTRLKDISVGRLGKSYNSIYHHIPSTTVFTPFGLKVPNLERLSIPWGELWIARQMPYLRHLVVSEDTFISASLMDVVRDINNLESLVVYYSHQTGRANHDTTLISSHVKALGLRGHVPIELLKIADTKHNLELLELTEIPFFLSRYVPDLCKAVETLPKLRILILSRGSNHNMPENFHQCI